ncbi:hypothetical protein GA565_23350 [Rouxiella sp. S1S-2]|nr:hypothetical protein GA565_23350 [Rouxiella sp. S1S-2]
MRVKFEFQCVLWITLCVNRYNPAFCCVLQQTVFFIEIRGCGSSETPYNAAPTTGNNAAATRCERVGKN